MCRKLIPAALFSGLIPVWAQMAICAQGNLGSSAPLKADSATPSPSNQIVELNGKIGQIQTVPGPGMLYLDVTNADGSTRVYLAPMRYLIAENFNPKSGESTVVKGYRHGSSIIAIQITLIEQKRTLKLRDQIGRPLWRGGPWRGGIERRMLQPDSPSGRP